jgi:thiamine monophosphate synthase
MNLKKLEYFFFIKNFNSININKIKKFKNMHIIYSYTKNSNFKDIINSEQFCKKNKIRFYISNYIKRLSFVKIDGIHIASNNKSPIYSVRNKIDIIGTAHNQGEYYIKKNQGCSRIFLSPLFYTDKYSNNKILKINRFNLISKSWGEKVLALGGVREKNLNQLKLLKISGIGSIGLFK